MLGPQTFLASLCSLLVDKVALRFAKTGDEILLNLPLAVAMHFPASLQLLVRFYNGLLYSPADRLSARHRISFLAISSQKFNI